MAPKRSKNKAKAEAAAAEAAAAEAAPAPKTKGAGGADEAPTPQVSREKVEGYLKKCAEMMKTKECRDRMQDVSLGRPGEVLVDLQTKHWDEFDVPFETGHLAVRDIDPSDKDLLELRQEVENASKGAYLTALQDRKPATLIKDGKLPREVVLEFFDAIQIIFEQKETRERLKKWTMENGDVPDLIVEEVHAELFETLGYEPKNGRDQMLSVGQHLRGDHGLMAGFQRWQNSCGMLSMDILYEAKKEGLELKCDEQTKARLLEMTAKESLEALSPEERSAFLEANGKKVEIFRSLPPDGRTRYLLKLSEDERLELMKAELLLVNVMQAEAKEQQSKIVQRTVGKFKPGTEFKTIELVKTIDKNKAAVAKNTFGRVIEIDNDGDLRVQIPSKERPFYFISGKDIDKLRVTREGWSKLYQGTATHPAFGKEEILVNMTVTGPQTGTWSMLGQTGTIKVEIEGDKIMLADKDTRFEGKKNKDGDYEGSVLQEGDANGHFVLKEVPETKL